MRIDPDAVYLEITTGAHIFNRETGKTRDVAAVNLHWKDGNRWQRRLFAGRDENDNLEAILGRLGAWVDQHGLQGALDQAMGREPS